MLVCLIKVATKMPRQISSCHSLLGSVCSDSASLTFQPSNLLTCQRSSPKSCLCHTSEKLARNSFACHTSKNSLPQVLYLPHIQAPPPGACVTAALVSSRAEGEGSAFSFAFFLTAPYGTSARSASLRWILLSPNFNFHFSIFRVVSSLHFLRSLHVQTKVLSFPHRPR